MCVVNVFYLMIPNASEKLSNDPSKATGIQNSTAPPTTVWAWASHFPSLGLGFPFGNCFAPGHKVIVSIKWRDAWEHTSQAVKARRA